MAADLTRILFAFLIPFLAGLGLQRCLASDEESGPWIERAGLWWLLGTGFISLAIMFFGAWLSYGPLCVAVTIASLGVLALSHRIRPQWGATLRLTGTDWIMLGVLGLQIIYMVVAGSKLALGWDALMTWEWKARLAFAHGGVLPAFYFSHQVEYWSHPYYPLQLPYVNSWFYLVLGRVDQNWIRVVGPMYFVAATAIIAGATQRLTNNRVAAVIGATALFFVPYLFAGPWGVFAGYADFPLGVVVLAALARIPDLSSRPSAGNERLFGILAALIPWMKREGLVLWLIAIGLAAVTLWAVRRRRAIAVVMLPGLIGIVAFSLWLKHMNVISVNPAVEPDFADLPNRLNRIYPVTFLLLRQWTYLDAWSLLWPGTAIAIIALCLQRKTPLAFTFGGFMVAVWAFTAATYVLGFRDNWGNHFLASAQRVILQYVPTAILAIAVCIPTLFPKFVASSSRNSQPS